MWPLLRRCDPPNANRSASTSTAAISQEWRLASKQVWRLRQQLAQSEPLGNSFNLARKSFEISQSDARQLFNFILSRLPLLQMSLEQAPTFVQLINIVRVARYIVQAVSTACRSRCSSTIPSLYE